jgi:exoribonuclease-2
MYVLFEDEGEVRAGTVRSTAPASLQVDTTSGRRVKVRAASVLLHFDHPAPAQLLEGAHAAAREIDVDFLWECAPSGEFDAQELAREYHGRTPLAHETAAILLRLHGSPVHFQRRGKGRFRSAGADVLQAALAGIARRKRLEEEREAMVRELVAGGLPARIQAEALTLLVAPDRGGIAFRALEQAARECQRSPLRLLLERGAIGSPLAWHRDSFLTRAYPRGTDFDPSLPSPEAALAAGATLPLAPCPAFSIDDGSTTEIDDAFSVAITAEALMVGIHIAVPALAIGRGDAIDAVARERMSTLYAPGMKVTMLPPAWVAAWSLDAGRTVPALSLYAEVDAATMQVRATRTVLERVAVAQNLRHDELGPRVDEQALQAGGAGLPFGAELAALWRLAGALQAGREEARGRPEPRGRVDLSVELEPAADATAQEDRRVVLRERPRDAPLDRIVAELMILANRTWGAWLAELHVPAIYRSQAMGRVRMSTTPAPHEGLGVSCYAWCTSPLRRYADLVNQRQLLAAAAGSPPPYAAGDAELFAAISAFDATYGALAEFQERLERYWCLRWLVQESRTGGTATVLRGEIARVDGLPLVVRLPGAERARGERVELAWGVPDLVDLSLEVRVLRVLAPGGPMADADADPEEEAGAMPGGAAVPAEAGTGPA